MTGMVCLKDLSCFFAAKTERSRRALLHYRNHLEACYCIGGEGKIEDMDGTIPAIRPGDMYVLDKHDRHYLHGGKFTDLILVSVFNPPLRRGQSFLIYE